MEEKKRFNRWLAAALVGIFLMASGGLALAAGSDAADTQSEPFAACRGGKMTGKADPAARSAALQTVLDKLVADNVLTREQADGLAAYLKTQAEQRQAQREQMKNLTPEQRQALRNEQPARQGFLDKAVADKVITQEQAQAIGDALRAQKQQSREAALQTRLAELVKQGAITQAQADAALAALQANWQQRQAEFEKIKNMSKEERLAYMKANLAQKQNPLQELINNGTLTQEQADQICPAHDSQGKGLGRGGKGCPMNPTQTSDGV